MIEQSKPDSARFLIDSIKAFVRDSPLNRLPPELSEPMFEEPLVQFADGDDPLFTEYKKIIGTAHLTPREALAKAYSKTPRGIAKNISVISWILPITGKTRQTNRRHILTPSRPWAYTRWYGEIFNDALRKNTVELLIALGHKATAPMMQPYFKVLSNEKGRYSNWSERHIAYAAGLGTFSLSDGFITEAGIAHRCGSIVTSLALPASPRVAKRPYENCLFHANGKCTACIARCPAGAITKDGHDKIKCYQYGREKLGYLVEKYQVKVVGCGLCQTKVPCESQNPTRRLNRKSSS
ncbi:MAG: hypothetical protein PHR56_03135 [Dehalococcoidales bacterium]|nr:hypothetical protein [Dehalococcoidales bacterium]